ncbi:STAS domain-containing protein [Iodidimonas sp. SYSU 1G8]|jgi:anti-anti-sigma factor|uniref:STAS domain-containing protein n=1 Tax=Iodidimonas sp. SYSU 1G8 TaxID=3133967 RepID=UPI0031FE776F
MEVKSETVGDALVVRPEGRVDSITSPALEAALVPLADRAGKVVIDCAGVTYVSSAGLRVFLTAAKTAKSKGGKIVLAALTPGVQEVFTVSGFSKIIEMYPTVDAAVA